MKVDWDEKNVNTCAKCGDLMGTDVKGKPLCHCGHRKAVKK